MPESAVMCAGTPTTASGSRMANPATSSLEAIGTFVCVCSSVTTANDVTSEPDPLVVGIATIPSGAPNPASRAALCITFVASITDPPP